jgi:hypothetical protein
MRIYFVGVHSWVDIVEVIKSPDSYVVLGHRFLSKLKELLPHIG